MVENIPEFIELTYTDPEFKDCKGMIKLSVIIAIDQNLKDGGSKIATRDGAILVKEEYEWIKTRLNRVGLLIETPS